MSHTQLTFDLPEAPIIVTCPICDYQFTPPDIDEERFELERPFRENPDLLRRYWIDALHRTMEVPS